MANKQIKLFVDAHSFDTGFQGTQTFIRELYTQLLKTRPELDIYFGAVNMQAVKDAFPSVKPENILLYKNRKPALLRFVFDIPHYIKKHEFEYAHFQYIAPLKQARCQYIVTTHDVLFNDFPADFSFAYRLSRKFLFGWSIKNATIKTTVSNYSRERIAHHYHIPAKEINVVPNGVNITSIAKQTAIWFIIAKFRIENFVLYVSRIEPRKNHVLLLETYLRLELYKQNISLVFIGEETMVVSRLQIIISKLTPEQRAMFYWFPQVDATDLKAFYSACRLFVYPSKAEGFGIPPLEAAVCRVPVLCSSAAAMHDFDFFKSYTFDPDSAEDLEFKMAAILADPPSDKALKNIAEAIADKYQWDQSAEILFELLMAGLKNETARIRQMPLKNKHLSTRIS